MLKAATGAMADAYPEARRLEDILNGGEGLVSGRGLRGITLSYSQPGRGVGVLRKWQRWRRWSKKWNLVQIVRK